jgi:hypothetical protein
VSFERIIGYLNVGQTNYISFMFLIGLNLFVSFSLGMIQYIDVMTFY